MLGLFFVYVTAINSTWDEEPKSESDLMLDAPAGAGCHSRACSCFGAARGLSSEGLSASPRFHKLNWGPSRPGGRGKVYVTLHLRREEAAEGPSLPAPGLKPARGCITTNQPRISSETEGGRKTCKSHLCYRFVFKAQPQGCLFTTEFSNGQQIPGDRPLLHFSDLAQ